jgi:nucleotide-binding universal stress UspA family protein
MKKYTKILLAVDFAPQSILMAHHARAIAETSGAEILAVHAVRPFEMMTEGMDVPGAVVLEWYEAQKPLLEKQLTAFCREHLGNSPFRTFLVEGEPAAEIVKLAGTEAVDLVLLATHGFGAFRRFILGSIAAKVLHDSPTPVLTGAHLQEPAPGSGAFRKIVVGVDLSPRTAEVLAAAKEVGAEEIIVVHAMPAVGDGVQRAFDPSWEFALKAAVETTVNEAVEKAGIQATIITEADGPAKLIHRVAQEQGADLVVIGRHSDQSLLGRLTAQAYAIVRESPCPVLSV